MKTSTQKILKQEDKRSYLIRVTKLDNGVPTDRFMIPVIDVRDGKLEREAALKQLKQTRQSKFLKPSFSLGGNSYQTSHKK